MTRKNTIKEKCRGKCAKLQKFSKNHPVGKSQPNEHIPLLGKELARKHLEEGKLCYSATAAGRIESYSTAERRNVILGDIKCQKVRISVSSK
jgi:hypothetical protein